MRRSPAFNQPENNVPTDRASDVYSGSSIEPPALAAAAAEGEVSSGRPSRLEEIHDDDDIAQPIPFNFAQFEDDGGKKRAAALVEEAGEDTRPSGLEELDDDAPLPFNFAHFEDDAEIKKRAAASVMSHSEVISSLPTPPAGVDDDGAHEHDNTTSFKSTQSDEDEAEDVNVTPENEPLQVAAFAGHNNTSSQGAESVDNHAGSIVNSSVQVIPHAYLVDEEEDDENIVVAGYAEPLLPWWKQGQARWMFAGIFLALLMAAIAIGILISRGGNTEVGATVFLTLTNSPTQSNAPSGTPTSVPTKECLFCKVVFGRQFEAEVRLQNGFDNDYLFQIKVCDEGDTSSNCGIYQTWPTDESHSFSLGSFTKFVDETDTSVTAIFQNGTHSGCPYGIKRSANVSFVKNCSQDDCDGYEIAAYEPDICEYIVTVTLTPTPSETPSTISLVP
jgi:hypothetical protein